MPLDYHCEYCNIYRTFQNGQEKWYWIKKHRSSKKHRRNAALKNGEAKAASMSVKELQDQITSLDSNKDDIFSGAMSGILKRILKDKQAKNGELFQ